MAAQTDISYVGRAFVRNFYHIMHHTPEFVHQFYKDSSTMRRQGPNGLMVTVNARKGIKDLVLSLNYKDFKADILTAFAHAYMNGVVIFVMGCMSGKDSVKRNFTELFFLAPQEEGFFLLLDVFRFTGENYLSKVNVKSAPAASAMPVEEMATDGASVEVNPETLGRAFVRHYYYILHKFPELMNKFFKDSSTMSRPGPDGTMVTVTAMKDNSRRNFTESFCLAPQEKGYFISNDTFRFMRENSSAGVISMKEKDAKSAAAAPVIPVRETTEVSCAVNNFPQRQQRRKKLRKPPTCLAPEDVKEETGISKDKLNLTFAENAIPQAPKNSLVSMLSWLFKIT